VEDLLDDDGYPTDEYLESIEKWNYKLGFGELMKHVRQGWWCGSSLWDEVDILDDFDKVATQYRISTGGWSGNEDIIGAMQNNALFWISYWVQSRRGGHYIFEVRHDSKNYPSGDWSQSSS